MGQSATLIASWQRIMTEIDLYHLAKALLAKFLHWKVTASTSHAVGLFLSLSLFFFEHFLNFSATTRCSRITLYISCSTSRISHFPQESQLLLLEVGRNQDLGAACVLLASGSSLLTQQGNPCIYTHKPLHIHTSLSVTGSPQTKDQTLSTALAGGFLTTGPSRKSSLPYSLALCLAYL